jgi:hypothetical protein
MSKIRCALAECEKEFELKGEGHPYMARDAVRNTRVPCCCEEHVLAYERRQREREERLRREAEFVANLGIM